MRRKWKKYEFKDSLFYTNWSRYPRPDGILKEPVVIDREIYNGLMIKRVTWLPDNKDLWSSLWRIEFYTNVHRFNDMLAELQELIDKGKEIAQKVKEILLLLDSGRKSGSVYVEKAVTGYIRLISWKGSKNALLAQSLIGKFMYLLKERHRNRLLRFIPIKERSGKRLTMWKSLGHKLEGDDLVFLDSWMDLVINLGPRFVDATDSFLTKYEDFLKDIVPPILDLKDGRRYRDDKEIDIYADYTIWPVFYLGFLQKKRFTPGDNPDIRSDFELWWPFIRGMHELMELRRVDWIQFRPRYQRDVRKIGRPKGKSKEQTHEKIEILRKILAAYPDKSSTFICEKAAEVLEEEIAQEIRKLEKKIEEKEERRFPEKHIRKDRENLRKLKALEREGIDPESLRRRYLKEAKLRLGQ